MNGGLIALIVLLSMIALFFILCCFPAGVIIDSSTEQTRVTFYYLFLRIPLLPRPKKKKKSRSQAAPQGAADKPDEADKKDAGSLIDSLNFLRTSLLALGRTARLVLSLHRAVLDLDVAVGGQDAAEIAIDCGKLSAFLHGTLCFLANFLTVRRRRIVVRPDYNAEKTVFSLHARVWLFPITLVFSLHRLLPELLTLLEALPDQKKKQKSQKRSENV